MTSGTDLAQHLTPPVSGPLRMIVGMVQRIQPPEKTSSRVYCNYNKYVPCVP